jgi:hypothetical protein
VSQKKLKNLLGLKKTLILVLVSLSLTMARSGRRAPALPNSLLLRPSADKRKKFYLFFFLYFF